MASLLGYEPTEYVPTNALVVFVPSAEVARSLSAALGSKIRHFERLQSSDRRSDIAAAVASMRDRPAPTRPMRATRSKSAAPPAADESSDDNADAGGGEVRLRVRSFYGSMRAEEVEIEHANEEYVRKLASAMSSMRRVPTPRIDESTLSITVEDVDLDEAEAASEAIVEHVDDVYWVEIDRRYETQNVWSVPVAQRAADGERTSAPSVIQGGSWIALLGLSGANQTIGISDTGIENQCFFSDGLGTRAGAWPTVSGLDRVPTDTGHPKIRAYSNGGVGGDFRDIGPNAGHGTHVCGTAAGRASARSQSAKYNGAAPDARIAFVDLAPSGNSRYLYVPDLLKMYRWFYDAGARVLSASWGSFEGGAYTIDERDSDAFVASNPETLVVYAAGNSGTEGSITAPGMCKNCLTVGATMNGYEAYALSATPPKPFASMTPQWLASFSSRGSTSLPFAKPDVVAPGGHYVWSASNDAPATGSCADETLTTTGYAGTSMATPLVAGTATLVYEMLQKDARTNGGRGLLERNGGGGLPVYASLVRAVLAVSGRPLSGIYPQTAYRTTAQRFNAEGFGRVALDRAFGPNAALAVLSNERAEHGLSRTGASIRACVDIADLADGATLAAHEIAVQLAYTDPPSSVVAKATLVNNLDLRVSALGGGGSGSTSLAVNYNPVNVSETRTTLERVVTAARALDVQIVAAQIGFGGAQKFSLVVVLRPTSTSTSLTRTLVITPLSTDGGVCTRCSDGSVRPASRCSRCGDARVDSGEQCEPSLSACCDASCRWKTSGACTTTVDSCEAQGQCRLSAAANSSSVCEIAAGTMYRVGADGRCQRVESPTPTTPTNSTACPKTAEQWFTELRTSGLPTSLRARNSSDLRICCQPFERFAFDRTPLDAQYHALAKQYIAARLNVVSRNISASIAVLASLRSAKAMLDSRCAVVGLLASQRADARTLANALRVFNEPGCTAAAASTPPPPLSTEDWCPAPEASAASLFCSGGRNSFVDTKCICAADRHAEPDCAHLSCSGRGASIYDYATSRDRCVCLPGWTGAACDKCANATAPNTRFLCIGATQASVRLGSPTYLLRAVDTSTVSARLSGTYYAELAKRNGRSTAPTKTADATPGAGGRDCWCRTNSSSSTTYATHYAAIEAATSALVEQMQWYAAFEQEFAAPATTVKTAAALAVAGAEQTRCTVALIALAALVLSQ